VNGIIQLEIVDQSQRVFQPVEVQTDERVERPTNPEQLRSQLAGLLGSTQKTYGLLRHLLTAEEQKEFLVALKHVEENQNGSPKEIKSAFFRLEHVAERLGQAMLRGGPPKGET
jgi:hypothetical protein